MRITAHHSAFSFPLTAFVKEDVHHSKQKRRTICTDIKFIHSFQRLDNQSHPRSWLVFYHGVHNGARLAIDPCLLALRRKGKLKVLQQGRHKDSQFKYAAVIISSVRLGYLAGWTHENRQPMQLRGPPAVQYVRIGE